MTAPQPTDAELAVLRVLWQEGPLAVRDVHARLYAGTEVGYTTTLRLLQNLLAKSLVTRDEQVRRHVYRAVPGSEAALRTAVRRFMDRVFGGSAAGLAMHALGAGPSSRAELTALKAMIARLERGRRAGR